MTTYTVLSDTYIKVGQVGWGHVYSPVDLTQLEKLILPLNGWLRSYAKFRMYNNSPDVMYIQNLRIGLLIGAPSNVTENCFDGKVYADVTYKGKSQFKISAFSYITVDPFLVPWRQERSGDAIEYSVQS